jgi:hypothetical protein
MSVGGRLLGTLQLTGIPVRAAHQMLGRPRCLTFGAKRVDTAIAGELLLAIQPIAVEAALQAEHRYMEQRSEQRRIVELELQQARPLLPNGATQLVTPTIGSSPRSRRRAGRQPCSEYRPVRRDWRPRRGRSPPHPLLTSRDLATTSKPPGTRQVSRCDRVNSSCGL